MENAELGGNSGGQVVEGDPCDVTADRPRPDGVASWTLGCDDPAGRLALVLADDTTWTDQ